MVQVVEITKGSKVKYELDKKTGLIKVRLNSSCFWHVYIMDDSKMGTATPISQNIFFEMVIVDGLLSLRSTVLPIYYFRY